MVSNELRKTLRDLIPQIKIPASDPPQYERSIKTMAELAKTYHENLQTIEITDESISKLTFLLSSCQSFLRLFDLSTSWKATTS